MPVVGGEVSYMQRSGGDGGVRRRDLLQQVRVGDRVLDVGREVSDLALTAGALEMVVDPANKQLLGRQQHQVVQGLAVLQQRHELLVMDEVDRRQQTDLHTTQTSPTPTGEYYLMYIMCTFAHVRYDS